MSDFDNPYASPQADLAPGLQWAQTASLSLARTATGLSLVYYGVLAAVLAILVTIAGMVAVAASGGHRFQFMLVGGLAILAGILMMLVGQVMCLWVPAETGAKGFAVGSVFVQAVSLAFSLMAPFVEALRSVNQSGLVNLIGWLSFVLFILFLRKLSLFIGRQELAVRARNLLLTLLVVAGLCGVAVFGPIVGVGMAIVAGIPAAIGGLIVLVMYVNLLNDLRKLLRRPPEALAAW